MGYAILRADKCQHRKAGAMIAHALRERPVANAVDGGKPPEVIAGGADPKAVKEHLASLVQAAKDGGQRWRKDAVEVVDLLVTTSRIDMQQMDLGRQSSYFRDALAWIQHRWPAAKVLTAAIHRDESTPHMQVLLAPTDASGRFNAKMMLGGPAEMSKLQDAFHEAVGAKYGLSRGEKHSNARHVPVRQLYAAMATGAEPPKFVPVPTVPAEPTLADKITGKAGEIEAARRKAEKDRQAALEHNKRERDKLHAQAARGRALHPKLVERMSDKYRAATRAEDAAKKAQLEAQNQRQAARNDLVQAQALVQQARASEAAVAAKIDGIVLADAQAIDRFSRHWSREYVGRLAKDLGVELVAGKGILDQLRRHGLAKTVVEAAQKLDQWDQDLLQQTHRWQERQAEVHRPKGG
jgi:hypothetical protein